VDEPVRGLAAIRRMDLIAHLPRVKTQLVWKFDVVLPTGPELFKAEDRALRFARPRVQHRGLTQTVVRVGRVAHTFTLSEGAESRYQTAS